MGHGENRVQETKLLVETTWWRGHMTDMLHNTRFALGSSSRDIPVHQLSYKNRVHASIHITQDFRPLDLQLSSISMLRLCTLLITPSLTNRRGAPASAANNSPVPVGRLTITHAAAPPGIPRTPRVQLEIYGSHRLLVAARHHGA